MSLRCSTRSTIYLAALWMLATACAPALYAASAVGLKLTEDDLIVIPVTANGQGPFYFLLDTGTDVTVVDTALAKRLALTPLQSANFITLTGSETVSTSRLATLAVGNAQVDNLPVFQKDLSSLHRINDRIAGVVGQDFLSHFNYLLDYRARSIRFEEADDIHDGIDGDPVPIETGKHRMILAAKANSRGHAVLRLLLDSGTNMLVLIGSVSRPLHCSTEQQAVGFNSTGAAPTGVGKVDLTVASHEFRNLLVSLATDAEPQPIGDGLLPLALFNAIYVNNSQSYVVLNPHAKKTEKRIATSTSQKTMHADR